MEKHGKREQQENLCDEELNYLDSDVSSDEYKTHSGTWGIIGAGKQNNKVIALEALWL